MRLQDHLRIRISGTLLDHQVISKAQQCQMTRLPTKEPEDVSVLGGVKRVFGDVQRPAASTNDGCVGSTSRFKLNGTLLR